MAKESNYETNRLTKRRYSVAMVCDFFYPRLGGVEMHIWSLSYHLIKLGHKVIVITHAYNCPDVQTSSSNDGSDFYKKKKSKRTGVRYLPGGLKVYYCPFLPMVDQDCLPTFTISLPLLRWIFIREGIEIVHAHQATSTLANEAVTYAAELGLASVYTDHSLFGFDDVASIILNRVCCQMCQGIQQPSQLTRQLSSFRTEGAKSNHVDGRGCDLCIAYLQRQLHFTCAYIAVDGARHSKCCRFIQVRTRFF